MTPDTDSLLQKLRSFAAEAGRPSRYLVAYSGGLDSTVLLHMLASSAASHEVPVVAVHVDHGLQPAAADWRRHCAAFAAALGVEYLQESVTVSDQSELGVEAAARAARYRALAALMNDDDWLLSAHHRDDQAETLLLNLIRGGGPAGLAGIGEMRPFARGWLLRPLLSYSRSELADYADAHGLTWIEDPSNEDQRFDRNFLRHEILPGLESRWPEAAKRLQRSSRMAGDAANLLDDLAAIDAKTLGSRKDRIRIDALAALTPPRQRNVLRYVIRQLDLPVPSAAHVQQILQEVVTAGADRMPLAQWGGAEIRRYRDQLYLLPEGVPEVPGERPVGGDCERLELGGGLGRLRFESGAPRGIDTQLVERGLVLGFRRGGEKFRPAGQPHTKKLKKLLQDEGIVPWMRDRIPLLYAGGDLVAVADLWLADNAASEPGTAVHWERRPAIH